MSDPPIMSRIGVTGFGVYSRYDTATSTDASHEVLVRWLTILLSMRVSVCRRLRPDRLISAPWQWLALSRFTCVPYQRAVRTGGPQPRGTINAMPRQAQDVVVQTL